MSLLLIGLLVLAANVAALYIGVRTARRRDERQAWLRRRIGAE